MLTVRGRPALGRVLCGAAGVSFSVSIRPPSSLPCADQYRRMKPSPVRCLFFHREKPSFRTMHIPFRQIRIDFCRYIYYTKNIFRIQSISGRRKRTSGKSPTLCRHPRCASRKKADWSPEYGLVKFRLPDVRTPTPPADGRKIQPRKQFALRTDADGGSKAVCPASPAAAHAAPKPCFAAKNRLYGAA